MRYPGGKGKCYQHLINLMPPHEVYIESHLGGGSVLRNKKPSRRNIGIERNPLTIARWRVKYPEYCELVEDDALNYLEKFKFSGNELIYSDPPYLQKTRKQQHIYTYDYSENDHERLLSKLTSISCLVMISGYDSELYNDVLGKWTKRTFNAKTHTDIRQECVWLNFKPPSKLHDTRYLGSTFRERQNVKRRLGRFKEKIERLDPIEQNELLQWINQIVKRGGRHNGTK